MEGEPPAEEDFSLIPVLERCVHKNWKARLSAYTEIIQKSGKTASDNDPFFKPYISDGSLLRKLVLDANAVAQEKGIEAVLAIVRESGENSAKTRPDVAPALVDKALGSTRAGTKNKGLELCLMYCEVENGGEGVMMDVLKGLESKQPKVVAGSVACLKELVASFGVGVLGNVKPLLKSLAKIFGHTDKAVRAEGTALTQALYTFLGPALNPSIADLKPVQIKELQESFDAMDKDSRGAGSGKPTRFTRQQARDSESAAAAGTSGDVAEEEADPEPTAIDPTAFIDPVDILPLCPPDLLDILASTKWKDKVEALTAVSAVLAANPKVSDLNADQYSALAQILGKRCQSDSNVNVVIAAAQVIGQLARGMGRAFGRHKPVLVPQLLERMKERKATVTDALGQALDGIFTTVTLGDIGEDILTAVKSKNPQVKEGTLRFLSRSLCTTTDAPPKDLVKPLAEALITLLGDSFEPVRLAAADCLAALMKILGERAMNPYTEGVSELQMAKVKEALERVEIKYKAGGATARPKVLAAAPSAPATRPMAKAPIKAAPPKVVAKPPPSTDEWAEFAPPKSAPPARLAAKVAQPKVPPPPARPAASKATNSVKAASSSKALAVSPTEPVKYKYSAEEALAKAADDVPQTYHIKLADAAWKTRLEAAEELVTWLSGDGANEIESEVLFRFLCKIPGWSEKNFQVSAKIYNAMAIMADRSSSFGRSSAALVIGPLSDKLGDMKLKKPSGDALVVFAEKTSLAFVLAQAYEPMTKQKAPKAQADALTWIKTALIDFGIAGLPLKDLVAFLKNALQSSNAAVRSSATSVLVTLRLFVGTDVVSFLEDLNPQLLTTINSEFEKVAGQAAPEPTRTSADLQSVTATSGSGGASAAAVDPLDDLIPRVDVDKLVASTSVVADSKSDAWKTRKEAFESLSAVLEVGANARLKPNMGEITTVLKRAMNDTNLAVKMLALGIVSKIAAGMGQPFEKHARILVTPVANVCADQKTGTRTAALACLTAIKDACGLDPMYAGLATSIETPNPLLRSSVLAWLATELQAADPSPDADLAPLAAPIISCLEDRNGEVRKSAAAVLPFVIARAGYDFVVDQTNKLKAASKSTVMAVIQNAKPIKSAAAPAPAAVSARPTPGTPKAAPRTATAPRTGPRVAQAVDVPRQLARPDPAASRSLAMKALSGRPVSRAASTEEDDLFARPASKIKVLAKGRPGSTLSSHEIPSSAATTLHSASATPTDRAPVFTASDPEFKRARAKKDVRWACDQPARSEHLTHLESQMEQSGVDQGLIALLFSKDHQREKDFEEGLKQIEAFYSVAGEAFGLSADTVAAIQVNNVDLVLKYLAIRLSSNNSILTNKSLDVLAKVLVPEMTLSQLDCQIILPAVVLKLGDNKFKTKVDEIFGMINNSMPPSLVASQLVLYGFESRNSKTRSESLAAYRSLITKRPSFAKACVSDKKLYPALTKLISDAGAREGALTLIATLVQYLGAPAVLKYITPLGTKEQGLLNNRLAATAASQPGPSRTIPVPSKTTATPLRPARAHATATTQVSRVETSRAAQVEGDVEAIEADRPTSPVARVSRIPAPSSMPASPSRLARKVEQPRSVDYAEPAEVPPPSRGFATRPLNGFGARPSMAGARAIPLQDERPVRSLSNVHLLISDIGKMGPTPTVDVIKKLEYIMKEQPEDMRGHLTPLVVAVVEVMQAAFAHDPRLESDEYYRLVKHAVQVTNEIVHCGVKAGQPGTYGIAASDWSLTEELTDATLFMLFKEFTLRLVNTDDVNRRETKDLSRYINMTVLELLSSCDRLMTYQALFDLMVDLSRNFVVYNIDRESSQARHADLVMKCIWKRADSIVKDLDKGVFTAGELLKVMETLFSVIPPSSWRAMGEAKVALGDMPLRTVKSMIQRIGVHCRDDVYDSLADAFGDADAGQSNVYQYLHKFMEAVKKKDKEAAAAKSVEAAVEQRPRTPPTVSTPPTTSTPPSTSTATAALASAKEDVQIPEPVSSTDPSTGRELQETAARNDMTRDPVLERLESLIQGSVGKALATNLDEIHKILTEHPEYDAQFASLAEANTSVQYGLFLQRGLQARRSKIEPVASQEPPVSPEGRPSSAVARIAARRSLGRPPSTLVPSDVVNGDVDTRLEHYKGVFSRQRERGESRPTSLGGEPEV